MNPRNPQNPYPNPPKPVPLVRVRVFAGRGTGSPGKPQGYPWQSLVTDEEDADYNHGAKQHGTADLLEEGFFFLDEDSDSDEDSVYGEEDIDEEELAELKTEDNIHRFNAILAEAQAVAIQAAKEAAEYLKSCLPNFFFFRNPTFGHSSSGKREFPFTSFRSFFSYH